MCINSISDPFTHSTWPLLSHICRLTVSALIYFSFKTIFFIKSWKDIECLQICTILYICWICGICLFLHLFLVFFSFFFFTLIEVNKFTNKRAHTFNEDNQIKCRATSEHAAIFFLLHKFLQHLCTHWLWLNLKLSLFFFCFLAALFMHCH